MFTLKSHGELKYYTIDEFEKTGLCKHCFTTRAGGVSENEYKSLNLRMNCDDKRENILKNYKIICDEININYENLVLSKQVHEDKIWSVTEADRGNGITKPQKFESADALMTNRSGVPIMVFSADCVPVFFLDGVKKVIALAHSGWKGTVAEISRKVAERMQDEFGCAPCNIKAAIGPSIGVCHFEVGDDVAEIFRSRFGESVLEKHEKYHVNMQKAIVMQLLDAGILSSNIICADICTFCNGDLLFSHRKTNGKRGVMGAIMELK